MSPISNASRLADFGTGIGTAGAIIQVDNVNQRVGIGTTNPQATLQVGTGITIYADAGIISATSYSGNWGGSFSGSTATFSGAVNIDATTDSTSSSTGALIVDGGVGIAKNVYIGAGLSVAGTLTYEDVTNVDSVGLITAKSGVNVSGGQVTIGTGITMGIAGVATFSGTSDVHLLDNVKLLVGDGSDIEIYHEGSTNVVKSSVAMLFLAGGENAMKFSPNGSFEAYYDNSKKIETTTSGVTITGEATADGLIVGSGITFGSAGVATFSGTSDVHLHDNVKLLVGDSDDLQIYNDGTNVYIKHVTAGAVYFDTTTNLNLRVNSSETAILATANEGVEIRYNDSKKWETTNDGAVTTGIATATAGVDITGGTLGLRLGTGATVFSPGSNLLALGTNDSERLRIQSDGSINIETALGTANEPLVEIYNKDGSVMTGQCLKLRSNRGSGVIDTAIFAIHDDGDDEIFRVDNGGSVGIGTTTCLNPLHVHGPTSGVGPIIQMTNDTGDCRLFFGTNSTAGSANAQGQMRYNVGTNLMQFYTGGSSRFLIGSTGISTFSATPHDDLGSLRDIPAISKSSSHTLVASDAGKVIYISTGGVTVNPSVFSGDEAVTIINNSGSDQTITQGSSFTLYNTSDASTGNKTLSARGMATLWFSSNSQAYISGNI